MEFKDGKFYLTIREQVATGFASPIDPDVFPLHEKRQAADAIIDTYGPHGDSIPPDAASAEAQSLLAKAQERSEMLRRITRELAELSMLDGMLEGEAAEPEPGAGPTQ